MKLRLRPWGWIAALALAVAPWAAADERPFTLIGGQVVIPVKVEGHETLALLDTGANRSGISESLARELKLATLKHGRQFGAGDAMRNYKRTEMLALDLGGGTVIKRRLATLPADGQFAPRGVEMIIGMDAFWDQVLSIDFDRLMFDMTPYRSFKAPAQPPLKLNNFYGVYTLDAKLGETKAKLLIDTAASSALHVEGLFERNSPALKGLPRSQTIVAGIDSVSTRPVVALPSLEFAGYAFRDVPVTVGPFSRDFSRADGLLGVDVLRRFNLVIDYGLSRMWLTPNSALDAPFRKNRIGLFTANSESGRRVTLAAPGSPAEAAGFVAGEVIAAFETDGGVRVPDAADVAEGARVIAVMADGSRREMTARAYY
jgi:hypothetical protein